MKMSLTRIKGSSTNVLRISIRNSNALGIRGVATKDDKPMPWPEYFKIRKSKQKWELATTIPSSMIGLGAGIAYFGTMQGTAPILGMEPYIIYSAASVGCVALGWLVGPTIGGSFWRLSHKKALKSIEARDKEFHNHLVKNRVDPSRQSAVNPVPDYYGEKIGSLSQYRQWLRDQGKFRRKALLPEE